MGGFKNHLYVKDGKVYLIRSAFDGGHFISFEYATLSGWTELRWTPCWKEGVDFTEIEPLGEVSE
jgi:hypothetical protein